MNTNIKIGKLYKYKNKYICEQIYNNPNDISKLKIIGHLRNDDIIMIISVYGIDFRIICIKIIKDNIVGHTRWYDHELNNLEEL